MPIEMCFSLIKFILRKKILLDVVVIKTVQLFLMTGDDLWTGHLQELQGMMTSASLSSNGHSSGVAWFALEASREYRTFISRVHQKLLSTMLTSNIAEPPIERLSDEMTEEIETILV